MADDWSTYGDLVGQTIKVFVPAIGIVEGAVQAVTTGSPLGAAKVLIPGIGIVEAATNAGSDVWQVTGGLGGIFDNPFAQNAAWSFGTVALIGVAAVVLVLVLKK